MYVGIEPSTLHANRDSGEWNLTAQIGIALVESPKKVLLVI